MKFREPNLQLQIKIGAKASLHDASRICLPQALRRLRCSIPSCRIPSHIRAFNGCWLLMFELVSCGFVTNLGLEQSRGIDHSEERRIALQCHVYSEWKIWLLEGIVPSYEFSYQSHSQYFILYMNLVYILIILLWDNSLACLVKVSQELWFLSNGSIMSNGRPLDIQWTSIEHDVHQ